MLPRYYSSVNESHERFHVSEYPVNPRYFNDTKFHVYYTAGDAEQFQETIQTNLLNEQPDVDVVSQRDQRESMWETVQTDAQTPISELFTDLTTPIETTAQSYDYISETISKGTYVEIRDGKLVTLLPFRNMNFYREAQSAELNKHQTPRQIKEILESVDDRLVQNPHGHDLNPSTWRLNGPLIRYESPPRHTVSKSHVFQDMFLQLLETRQVPDCAFFLNSRDFPILREDGKNPNPFWFNNQRVENFPDKFIPVLGMSSSNGYADIPIPTWDDWARINALENPPRYFYKATEKDYTIPDDLPPFSERQDRVIFRGGTTGAGVTTKTNPRLGAVRYNGWKIYSDATVKSDDKIPNNLHNQSFVTVDIGLTKLNNRPRKLPGGGLAVIPSTIDMGNNQYASYAEQARCKYILNIDGHVTAFRLSMELASGSVVLLQENSPYTIWYKQYLQPYVHYVPVEYDLRDLPQKIQWCMAHQDECQAITVAAREFYDTFLQKDGILDYLQTLLFRLTAAQGENRSVYPIDAHLMQYQNFAAVPPSMRAITPDPVVPVTETARLFGPETHTLQAGLDCVVDTSTIQIRSRGKPARVEVTKHRYSDDPVMIVAKQRDGEAWQTINENFIGRNIVNSLLEVTPGFTWTFQSNVPSKITFMANVPGGSLSEAILRGDVPLVRRCLGMIGLTLATGQHLSGLCLNKLHPNDIVLRRVPTREVTYVTPRGVFSVQTDVIPTIVDYTYARGHPNSAVSTGLYGYACRIFPWFGLDMFSLAVNSVHMLLTQAQTVTVDTNPIRAMFDGLVKIPKPQNASTWVRENRKKLFRWVYAPYMYTAVDLQRMIPEISITTDELTKKSLRVIDQSNGVTGVPRWNTTANCCCVVGCLQNGVAGIKRAIRQIYVCGFYVTTMLEKAYLKEYTLFPTKLLVETLRRSDNPVFGQLAEELDRKAQQMEQLCFVGQYLDGTNSLPKKSALDKVNLEKPKTLAKLATGPGYVASYSALQRLDQDSSLKTSLQEYVDTYAKRMRIIATVESIKQIDRFA